MSPPKSRPKSRRGFATIERYSAEFVSQRGREGLVQRYLREDGLDEAQMSADEAAAYRRQVFVRAAAKARAAKVLKAATRRAEREAMAEVMQAQKAAATAQARANRAHEEVTAAIQRATSIQMEATAAAMRAADLTADTEQ